MSGVNPERLRRLFWNLLRIYSPSGKEGEICAYLEEFLAAEGCPYGVQPVDEDRYNLVLGRPDAPIVLVGHVDTVDAWDLDAREPEDLGGGWIGGLGTADMKGGCAAMVEAYLSLREEGWGGAVGLALVVGEEDDGDGAEAFLREVRPARVLVGEPTDLVLCTGHYGYLELQVSARGRRVHASLPEQGANAAERLLRALTALLQEGPFPPRGSAVVSIRHLETGDPGFAVPSRAVAWLDVHVPPDGDLDAVRDRIAGVLARADGVELACHTAHPGFRQPEDDPVVQAFRAAGGTETGSFRSHSDANRFHLAGVPVFVLGPGSLEHAHTDEERVRWEQVVEAARLYRGIALHLARKGTCAPGPGC